MAAGDIQNAISDQNVTFSFFSKWPPSKCEQADKKLKC
jgi:hypothetical protein